MITNEEIRIERLSDRRRGTIGSVLPRCGRFPSGVPQSRRPHRRGLHGSGMRPRVQHRPVAHVPLSNFKDMPLPSGTVDARGAGEMISANGLACVLIRLQASEPAAAQIG